MFNGLVMLMQILKSSHFLATSLQDKSQEAMRRYKMSYAQGSKLNFQFLIRYIYLVKTYLHLI